MVDHVFNRVWESISIVVPDNVIILLLNVLGSSVITDLALVDHANEIEEEGCENDLAESFLELKHFLRFSLIHDDAAGDSSFCVFVFFKNRFEKSNCNFCLLNSKGAKHQNAEVDYTSPV